MTRIRIYPPLPKKKYQIIYADPPWKYKDKALAGNRGACCKYSVMDMNNIINLPIYKIADDNCVLFLWVTNPMLFSNESFDSINKIVEFPMLNDIQKLFLYWGGFRYKTKAFEWIKLNKKKDSLFWGMGYWTRSNDEQCLLAMRGNIKRQSASVHSVVMSKIREHSRKPDEVRERIVELVGDLPRIELFATENVDGWDSWGLETNKY